MYRFPRLLKTPSRSFFLFGPRGTGKSTWLKAHMPHARRLDLLDSSLYFELLRDPHRLEAMLAGIGENGWAILDEVQRTPMVLDEVHRLMEDRGISFALCGSSARKLTRGGANLLAGRALTLAMEGFCSEELAGAYDLDRALQWGTLPIVFNDAANAAAILSAYVNTYIREEIAAEGLVRKTAPFVRFLAIAGQLNGQPLNAQNVARDAAVARSTVDTYFSILSDTHLCHFLPGWRPALKIKEVAHPKFYWFDTGVARAAAGWLHEPVDRLWLGIALETLVYHEMRVYNQVSEKFRPLYYYRIPSGLEVDFIVETSRRTQHKPAAIVAIEVKLSPKWNRAWEKSMRALAAMPNARIDGLIGVYTGQRTYHFDGIDVLPVKEFLRRLFKGKIF